jgi:hypothetical protein
MKDLHNVIKTVPVIAPVAIGTTGTGQAGKIIDLLGYGGVEFVFAYGSIAATNAVITPVMKEGDVTGTMTSVADADMLPMAGGEVAAGVPATTPRTSGVSKNFTTRLGYKGNKRYVQIAKLSSTITAATPVSVTAILHTPNVAPTPV